MLKTSHKKSRIFLLIGLIVIRILYLSLVFYNLDGQLYAEGVSYGIDFNPLKELFAISVFAVLSFLYIQIEFKNIFVQYLSHFLFIIYFIPMNSAFSLNNASLSFFITSTLFCIILYCAFYLVGQFSFGKHLNKKLKGKLFADNLYVRLFCFFICVFLILHKLMYNGLSFSLSIHADLVYAHRAAYHDYTQSISGSLYAYCLSIVKNLSLMVIPYYLLISLINKKVVGVVTSTAAVLAMYSISFEKANLLNFGIAIMLFVCYKFNLTKHLNILITVAFIGVILACYAENFIRGESSLFIVIVRRMMYLPSWISTMYHDFFSQNPKVLWSQDVFLLKKFFTPVYNDTILNIINNNYFAGTVPSPNSGLFSEAYMHFGFAGIFIYPTLISVLTAISGKIYKSSCDEAAILMAVQFSFSLVNVPITWTETVLSYFLFTIIIGVLAVINPIKFKSKSPTVFRFRNFARIRPD